MLLSDEAPVPLPENGPLQELLSSTMKLLSALQEQVSKREAAAAVHSRAVWLLATLAHWLQLNPSMELLQPASPWFMIVDMLFLVVHALCDFKGQERETLLTACWQQLEEAGGAYPHHLQLCQQAITSITGKPVGPSHVETTCAETCLLRRLALLLLVRHQHRVQLRRLNPF